MKHRFAHPLWIAVAGVSAMAAPESADLEFFETSIRPLLAERCYKCHSAGAEKLKGGLKVDHISSLLQGGDSGPALVPGKPDESRLIESVRFGNVDLQMPPRKKLRQAEIQLLEEWVRRGAPWPDEPPPEGGQGDDFDLEARRDSFWCWQPIRDVAPPRLERADWARSDIDRFILARLRREGLEPSAETDRRTWLRRVTFDLVGLPPSPEEIVTFVADTAPAPTNGWSTGCWRRRISASAGAATGWTRCATPRAAGTSSTTTSRTRTSTATT